MTLECALLLATAAVVSMGTAAAAGQRITVGDERLKVTVELGDRGPIESPFLVDGKQLSGLSGAGWSLAIDGAPITSRDGQTTLATKAASGVVHTATFHGENAAVSWKLAYGLTGPGRITKTLSLTPKRDSALDEVALWDAASGDAPAIAKTGLQDIAAFYRQGERGLFASLDFPYSKIATGNGRTRVSYPPHTRLAAGQTYICHSLTIGATKLTGRDRYGFDDGEVEAIDSYVQERFAPRFEKPMFVSACINNRYTQVDGRTIFYTMRDHPTLTFNLDLLKSELALMPRLGMEYYQVFPGVFDWAPDDPKPETVREIADFARKHRVKIGDYSGASSVFCGHYNEYGNKLERPEWYLTGEDGKPAGGYCFGCPGFVDWYISRVVPTCKEYGFKLHCLDFLALKPCWAKDHGHPAGPESIYHQVLGVTRLVEGINSVAPDMMAWPNSGCWQELLPKLVWYTPNVYLTDPFIASPWQGLNSTRVMDDSRREQMVGLHYKTFIPYRYFTNCQYFFCQGSPVPDVRGNYEFGALSTLAVTPNLCLAEIRPWIDQLKAADQQRVISFYKKWTGFLKQHFELWKKTFSTGEEPGMGAVEVYGHAKGDHGFIFLVNPQYWDRTVELPLDASLGFEGKGKCEVAELYPTERLRLTPQGPFVKLGSRIALRVPAQQVIVLEIRPAPKKIDAPRLYGITGTIEPTKSGCLVKTSGLQGHAERFAVLLPPGSAPIVSAEARPDVPKQPKRTWEATPVKVLETTKQGSLVEVTLRRGLAPTELREWRVKHGGLADAEAFSKGFSDGELLRFPLFVDAQDISLPMWDADADKLGLGPFADFCGAYVENAFSEDQETWIELKTASGAALSEGSLSDGVVVPEARPMHALAKSAEDGWWLQTAFKLPFMYTLGMEPPPDDHTLLVLPMLRQSHVEEIRVWVNGAPLEVRAYRYPRNRRFACYYADLVGSGAHGGDNTVVVYFQTSK